MKFKVYYSLIILPDTHNSFSFKSASFDNDRVNHLFLGIRTDEVSRVFKTPGDPCGYTRKRSGRSGLLLTSPWLSLVHFLFLAMLFTKEHHFFFLFCTVLIHLLRVQLHFSCRSSTAYEASHFRCSCNDSQHYIFLHSASVVSG